MNLSKEECVRKYVEVLQGLILTIQEKGEKDRDIKEMADKFATFGREAPELIVDKTVPLVWKYREELNSGNVAFFLNRDYTDDIREMVGLQEMETYSFIPQLISKLKATYHKLDRINQEVIKNKMRMLVKLSAGYLKIIKHQ